MKTTKIILALGLFLLITACITNNSYSQKFYKSHKSTFFHIERYADELGLSDEQLTTLKEKRSVTEKQSIELNSQIQIANLELRELLDSENPKIDEIKKKIEQIGKLKSDLSFTKVKGQLEFKSVLTSEQLKKLKVLKKERMKPHRQRGRRFRK